MSEESIFQQLEICQKQRDNALSKIAALREELATSKRNEHNSEVAYKAAIEKQEELRAELSESEEELDTVIHHNIDLQRRLADAERRNSEREANLLKATAFVERLCASAGNQPSIATGYLRDILDALNPKPEAASHDGKPPIGSVVAVHGGIKATVKAHHADGLIVGAGDGHLVTEWIKP